MIEHAQGVVARHPEFAFGHDVLAAAYAEAAEDIDVPDRAQAMNDAARREANLTLKLDPEDAGAYAILAGLEPTYDYRAQEAILLRGIKFAKHPKQPLGALYSYEGTLLGNVGRLREALSYQLVAHATDEWGAPKTAQACARLCQHGEPRRGAEPGSRRAVQLWPNHSGVRARAAVHRRLLRTAVRCPCDFQCLDAQTSPDDKPMRFGEPSSKPKRRIPRQLTAATSPQDPRGRRPGQNLPRDRNHDVGGAWRNQAGHRGRKFRARSSTIWSLGSCSRQSREVCGRIQASFRLAARMGLIKYWRETGKRPDFCTDRASRSECSPQLLAALKS